MLDCVEDAILDISNGKPVIVVDDEDRENEGDMICAAESITPEIVNFMSREARGLMCVALTAQRCNELNLVPMVKNNTSHHQTAFTISVDLKGYECTTGISAADRAKTIKALTNLSIRPDEFGSPGHIFPLVSHTNGVLGRPGHTEAAVELARLAGFSPSGVLIEVLNDDGTMARLPELRQIADKFDLRLISIKDIISHLVG